MIRISLFLCSILFATAFYAQKDSSCDLPDGGVGVCKPIVQCKKLSPLIHLATTNTTIMDYLMSLKCGAPGTYSVCCSDCYNPDGFEGSCQSFENCPNLQQLMVSEVQSPQFNFLKNSLCNPNRITFCCGPPPKAVQVGRCNNPWYPVDPDTECCGIDATAENKITGGTVTPIDAYPWLVLLEYWEDGEIKLSCGGSLISGKYVVTAAHCIQGEPIVDPPINVRLGEFDTSNNCEDCVDSDCTDPLVRVPIEEIIVHPEHSNQTKRNDIALIRLQYAVNYTDFIRPICLPTSTDVQKEELPTLKVYAAGWGKVSWNQSSSSLKQHVQLPLVDMQVCQELYLKQNYRTILWSRQLCAGGENGRDTCNGDSGGPLMVEVRNSHNHTAYSLAGVVSFGPQECGTDGVPGVYTKVYDYNTWLRSNMRP